MFIFPQTRQKHTKQNLAWRLHRGVLYCTLHTVLFGLAAAVAAAALGGPPRHRKAGSEHIFQESLHRRTYGWPNRHSASQVWRKEGPSREKQSWFLYSLGTNMSRLARTRRVSIVVHAHACMYYGVQRCQHEFTCTYRSTTACHCNNKQTHLASTCLCDLAFSRRMPLDPLEAFVLSLFDPCYSCLA